MVAELGGQSWVNPPSRDQLRHSPPNAATARVASDPEGSGEENGN